MQSKNGNNGRHKLPNIPRMAEPNTRYKQIEIRQMDPAITPMIIIIILNTLE
jgi:hypothetical protein